MEKQGISKIASVKVRGEAAASLRRKRGETPRPIRPKTRLESLLGPRRGRFGAGSARAIKDQRLLYQNHSP
jgi:hypothetical protein